MIIDLEFEQALHGVRQMTLVAVGASESMVGSEAEPGFNRLPNEDAEMKRLDELTDRMIEGSKAAA
jgi:hypothetical protein